MGIVRPLFCGWLPIVMVTVDQIKGQAAAIGCWLLTLVSILAATNCPSVSLLQ